MPGEYYARSWSVPIQQDGHRYSYDAIGNALLRLCDIPNGRPCQVDYHGEACLALQTCQSQQCPFPADKLESLQLCSLRKCAEHFAQCYGTYCWPWIKEDERQLLSPEPDFRDIPHPLDDHFQQQADLYNSTPNASILVKSDATANITAGVCALAPYWLHPCNGTSDITAIPIAADVQSAGSATRFFSVASCSADGIWDVGVPGNECSSACMFGECGNGYCDAIDTPHTPHTPLKPPSAPFPYVMVLVPALVCLACLLGVAWVRRRLRSSPTSLRAAATAAYHRPTDRPSSQHELDEVEETLPRYHSTPASGETRLQGRAATATSSPVESDPAAVSAEQDLADAHFSATKRAE